MNGTETNPATLDPEALRAHLEATDPLPALLGRGCCELARKSRRFCVCRLIRACPVHGELHVGSHD